jgi:hypothetical protein
MLSLDDISDLRAYERERPDFLRHIIALKARRRVGVGPHVTFVFENRDTIRFQIQEMARVEKLISDEAIENELRAYNPLIPAPGHLSATMFIELRSDEELRRWLPQLVGIETRIEIRLGEAGADGTWAPGSVVPCTVDPDHEARLTREDTTSAVHYVTFAFDADQVGAFAAGPASLAVTHPAYGHATTLADETRVELLTDLIGS